MNKLYTYSFYLDELLDYIIIHIFDIILHKNTN